MLYKKNCCPKSKDDKYVVKISAFKRSLSHGTHIETAMNNKMKSLPGV